MDLIQLLMCHDSLQTHILSVSYTHLDVYKRQVLDRPKALLDIDKENNYRRLQGINILKSIKTLYI